MRPMLHRVLFWTPRLITVAFALFLSIFALDVFQEQLGFGATVAALFVHLIPTIAVLLVLAIAWRFEWVGAALFPLLAVAHYVVARGRLHWSALATIELPLLLVGALFLLAWRDRHAPRPRAA